jgi:ABC-2 type transport system permease protein
MSLYLAMIGKSYRKHLAYRSEVWIRIVIGVTWVGIQVAVWRALIGSGEVDGIEIGDMITYAILNTVMALAMMDRSLADLDQKIRSGDIAVDLIKPFHYPLTLVADGLGRSLFSAIFSVLPTLVLAALFFGFQAPASVVNGLGFAVAFVLALSISFALACLVGMLGFYFLATFHFQWALGALRSLFAGTLVPLWFYPDGLRTLANVLPFQFLAFVPAATWMGQLSGPEIGINLALGIAWSVALLGLCWWLWSRIVTRLVVQGG